MNAKTARTEREPATNGTSPFDSDALLRSHGLRPTRARRDVLGALAAVRTHPTAEELQLSLGDAGTEISTATLYQNLNRLAEAGVILRFLDDAGVMRFDATTDHHHHLLCSRCARVVDVDLDTEAVEFIDAAIAGLVATPTGWLVEPRLELHGICPACLSGN